MPKHSHLPFIAYGTVLASAVSNLFKLLCAPVNTGKVLPTSNDNSENNIPSVGGDTPHNNLQPYITCYRWKRTAQYYQQSRARALLSRHFGPLGAAVRGHVPGNQGRRL